MKIFIRHTISLEGADVSLDFLSVRMFCSGTYFIQYRVRSGISDFKVLSKKSASGFIFSCNAKNILVVICFLSYFEEWTC